MNRVYLFESDRALDPLDLLRFQCDLYLGGMTLRERVRLHQKAEPTILPRRRPAPIEDPAVEVDSSSRRGGIFFPANLVLRAPISAEGPEEVGVVEDRIVFLRLGAERAARFDRANPEAAAEGLPRRPIAGIFIDRPWDLIRQQQVFLGTDAEFFAKGPRTRASVHRSVVVNRETGPVFIGEGAEVEPFAYIAGPAIIGAGAVVKAHAAIRGSFIGAGCRVGGEISASILFPFVNKQHHGFLGHAVVASWVNIGAGATGSNLKNTYGEIRVEGEATGLHYLGQVIGDHTKIGIQAVLNTGSLYGICSNLLADGIVAKTVGNFRFGAEKAEIEAVIRTARIAMTRRGVELAPAAEALIRAWHGVA